MNKYLHCFDLKICLKQHWMQRVCSPAGSKPAIEFRSHSMSKKILLAGAVLASLAPAAAFAQSGGAAAGAATGAVGGAIVGGPVGAAVGGVTGAIVGGIADQQQPEFRTYVTTQKVPSYTYKEEVRVGSVLPESGVTYYEVPAQYKVKGYRYTVVNNTPVLVEPSSRKIVQVIR
jgi:Protein of unknown function (DUF1236)/Glycine zipper